MRLSILIDKLRLEKKEFVTSEEVKEYCKTLKLDYDLVVRYSIWRKYLVRIFRGVFYVKSLEEFKTGKSKYNHLELVAKGLELKGVKNWYFGLHTALKLNNMTHEYFTIDEVISDSLFRAKPVGIVGYKFKFVKIIPSLFDFGIFEGGDNIPIRYSDPEKTILDFIYLSKNKGRSPELVAMDLKDWAENISERKLLMYAKKYPKTVANIARLVLK